MKIGFYTHPRKNIINEIRWIGENGFDFAELFLEADQGIVTILDPVQIRKTLNEYQLDVIGHSAWFLPIGSPFKEIRDKSVEMLQQYVVFCNRIECPKMTVHANWPGSLFSESEGIDFQNESLLALSSFSTPLGVTIIFESVCTHHDNKKAIRKILNAVPEIGFHADTGHLNLYGRDPIDYLCEFKDRLSHIHMHDNDGHTDLHLPMGTGNINWEKLIPTLKTFYDGTITLEIFSPDKDYALLARKKLKEKWYGKPVQ